MGPSALRPTFLWCVPTVAVLLSFLWFRQKRCTSRSDPGGTSHNSDQGDIKEVKVMESCSDTFLLSSSVDQLPVQCDGSEDRVISAREESIPSELCEESADIPNSVKLDETLPSVSQSMLPSECPPRALNEDSIDKNLQGHLTHPVIEELPPEQDSETLNHKEVTENVGEKFEGDSPSENVSNACINTKEKVCEKKRVSESGVLVLEGQGTFKTSQGVCETVPTGIVQEKMNETSVAENSSNDILVCNKEVVESVSTIFHHTELMEDGYPSKKNTENNNDDDNDYIPANILIEPCEFSKEGPGLNKYEEERSPDVNSPELKIGNLPAQSSQVESVTVCGTISDREVIKGVISGGSSSNVVIDKISEVVCASAVSDICQRAIARTTEEADGVVAEQSVSCMKNLAEGQGETSSSNDSPITAGAERDSANHSPADVMLASLSMSSYSDVHSEGSSDSGKGCSYVATPPSCTPASCSSLSGDISTHSVFEFVLPQQLVGRLIGRHGFFVHQIKAKTRANILIKRHPDTPKLKICAVEGTQIDIESALEMIREKFPAKRYPSVTLEQVCFLPPVPTVSLIPEHLQLQLVEGVNNDVILSSLVSPAHFFLQQPTHPTFPALNQLTACMNMSYSEPGAPQLPSLEVGIICAATTMGGWYRAQVVSVDTDTGSCDVKFIDYGGYLTLPHSDLRQIRSDFMTLPFQAAECYLAHVIPVGGISCLWSAEARAYVETLTQGHVLQAQVCGYAEDGIPVVYLFATRGTHVVPIHQELVAQGLAEWWEPSESEKS